MDVMKAKHSDLPDEDAADHLKILSDGRVLPGAKHEPVSTDLIFRVAKPVDFDRLSDEMKDAFGDRLAVIGASSATPDPISERNPLTLYVAVEDQLRGDQDIVRDVLNAHEVSTEV